jgi:hypothetical protein
VFITSFFVTALVQMVFMFLRTKQYNAARQYIVLANRCARLLFLVVGIASADIDSNRQRLSSFYALRTQHLHSTGDLAAPSKLSPLPPTSSGGDTMPAAALSDVSRPEVTLNLYIMMLKWVMLEPTVSMMHANFLVSFRAAAVVQFCTFCASAYKAVSGICVGLFVTDAAAAAAVQPACENLNWLVHAAEQLLDLQIPLRADELSVATDAVCAQPLVFLVVFHVWVRLVLLLLLPCTAVYCLQRHLKGMFLRRFAHAADNNAGRSEAVDQQQSQVQAGASSNGNSRSRSSSSELSRRNAPSARDDTARQHSSRQQQRTLPASQQQAQQLQQLRRLREQQLEQVLQAVEPAPAADLLLPASSFWFARCCVSAGLALFALILSWHLTELGVLAVLQRGQRTLVCDAQGWLRLA